MPAQVIHSMSTNQEEEATKRKKEATMQEELDLLRSKVKEAEERAQEAENNARSSHMRALQAEAEIENLRESQSPNASPWGSPRAGTPSRSRGMSQSSSRFGSVAHSPVAMSPGIFDLHQLQDMHVSELERRCGQLVESRSQAEAAMHKQECELKQKRAQITAAIARREKEYDKLQSEQDGLTEEERNKSIKRAQET